jgi:hypothetical protein
MHRKLEKQNFCAEIFGKQLYENEKVAYKYATSISFTQIEEAHPQVFTS